MESVNFFQVVPGSSFTIGDLIEVEIKNADGFIPKVDTKAMLTPDEVKTLSDIVARYK